MLNYEKSSDTILDVNNLNVYYGRVHVLQNVSFSMGAEPLGILGRNGMGKSTLVKALMGIIPSDSGEANFEGENIIGLPSYKINRRGVAYVPQGRRIFRSLSVHEHLTMVGAPKNATWNIDTIYETFPRLAERKKNGGAELSGGEQQMLSIARALLSNPRLLIMDEPSEGLAPAIVEHISQVFRSLVAANQAVLLIEQNMRFATDLCDRILFMVNGQIAADLPAGVVANDPEVQEKFLGVV